MIDDRIIDAVIDTISDNLPTSIAALISNMKNANPYVEIKFNSGYIDGNNFVYLAVATACKKNIPSIKRQDIVSNGGTSITIDCSNVQLLWKIYNDGGVSCTETSETKAWEVFRTHEMMFSALKYKHNNPKVTRVYIEYSVGDSQATSWFLADWTEVDNKTIYKTIANFVRRNKEYLVKKDIAGLINQLESISGAYSDVFIEVLNEMFSGAGIDVSKYL